MNQDYTHITFLLDRSGSMGFNNMWQDAIGGLKSLIEEQRKDKSLCTFSFCFFDTEIETPLKFLNIQEISGSTIDKLNIVPRGGTALLDALGQTIKDTGRILNDMSESEKPSKVIFMVQTDGQENSSREFTSEQINDLVKEHEEKYNWKFMFLSSDIQAVAETQSFGFAANSTMSFAEQNITGAYNVISDKLSQVRSAKNVDSYIKATTFNEDDKNKAN